MNSNEKNSLRAAVTEALALANEDAARLVAVNNVVNQSEWEVITDDQVMSIDWAIEAGDDLEEVVATIARVRGI